MIYQKRIRENKPAREARYIQGEQGIAVNLRKKAL